MNHTQFWGSELEGRQIWRGSIPDRIGKTLFSLTELEEPEEKDIRINLAFAKKLAQVRIKFGRAMNVTSACRSLTYNIKIGGHERSLHVYKDMFHRIPGCAAADISIHKWSMIDVSGLVFLAGGHGLSVGINEEKHFIHIDYRELTGLEQKLFTY